MGADTRLAHRVHIIDCRTEPNRLHDRRRTRLESVRRLAVSDAILEHLMNHFATAVERWHPHKMLVLPVKSANTGRSIKLVCGYDIEIAVNVANIDVEVHRPLGTIDQNRDAARMRDTHDLLHRNDRAKRV